MHPAASALTVIASGVTPCAARRAAFEELERRIRRLALPQKEWKLISQQRVPMQGSVISS
jgi:hypothetical protein